MLEKEYAAAMFSLGEECGTVENIKGDLELCLSVMAKERDYVKLLDTPAIPSREKTGLIDEAFGSLDENVVNLLKILSERHLVFSLPDIVREYIALYNANEGIENAEVVTAIPLDPQRMVKLSGRLSEITGKKIVMKNTVDPSILGGVKLRYMGKQLDSSIKTRLDRVEASLKQTII